MPDVTDDLAERLGRLAPAVDVDAGRAIFERSRSKPAAHRWFLAAAVVTLVVAGVAGLWAVGRGGDPDAVRPAGPTDGTSIVEGTVTEGNGYDTLLVVETEAPFGQAWLATDAEGYAEIMNPGPEVTPIDFGRQVALVMTRPDDACADTIVRFEIAPIAGVPTWTPVFEDLSSACDQPLLSWIYVVAIDRDLLGERATIVVPAAEIFDVREVLLEYVAEAPSRPDASDEDSADAIELTDTGIVLPVPTIGEPVLQNTSVGLLWLIAHDDGTVSVLPGTVPIVDDAFEADLTGLSSLVRVSASGRTLSDFNATWDDRGRTITGGRTNDLAGFAGRVVGDEVEVLTSTATRVDGAPSAPVPNEDYPLPDLGEPIDPGTFLTLSSNGPIWRYLDATLVVEDGVGRICDVPADRSVPELPTCDEAEIVLDTTITSTQSEITTWLHPPILAFQDPVDGFTTVVPLGGWSSRNDAPPEGSVVTVTGSRLACTPDGRLSLTVALRFVEAGEAELVVLDGDRELGTTLASSTTAGATSVSFDLADVPTVDARLHVASGASDLVLEVPTDPEDCPAASG